MAFNFRKFLEGINLVPKAVSTVDSNGDLDVTTDGVLHFHNGIVSSPLITNNSSGNLTNKTYASAASDVAHSGVVRLGNGEAVAWRNNADSADLSLIVTSVDSLEFNGNTLLTATGSLVANKAVITDGSAALTSSPTSAAEIAQIQGLTSPAVGTVQVQTLSNKTLTAPIINGATISTSTFNDPITLAEVVTPATPASGFGKIYFKSDGFLYQLDDGGIETKLAGSSFSSSGFNYISNPDFELNTTGYNTYNDGPTAIPTNGTGGVANITITRTTSTPLRGIGSGLITKDAANRQGQGVSADFTIADADKAQPLSLTFDYITSANFISGDTSDIRMWVYDITNSQLIQVAPYTIQGGSITSNKFIGTFQTNSNSNSYRLIFHIATTNASAWTFKFDDVSVSPQVINYGSPITDPQTYIPTGAWITNTSYIGNWQRIGDCLSGRILVSLSGAPNAASLLFSPAQLLNGTGLELDKDKLPGFSPIEKGYVCGAWVANDFLTQHYGGEFSYVAGPDFFLLNVSTAGEVSNVAPFAFNTNDSVTITFTIPIKGWGSNVLMSNDTDTRVVASRYYVGVSQTFTTGVDEIINFDTDSFDTHGAVTTGASWKFTTPVSGYYAIAAVVRIINFVSNGRFSISLFKNNARIGRTIGWNSTDVNTIVNATLNDIVQLNAGDFIDIRISSPDDANFNTEVISATDQRNWCSIHRLSGPSAIAISETIAATYSTATAQSIPNTTATIVDYNIKDYDSHNSVTTGASWKFTAPSVGRYNVNATAVLAAGGGWNAGESASISLYKNNVEIYTLDNYNAEVAHSSAVGLAGSSDIQLLAGDFIDIRLTQTSGGAIALDPQAKLNHVSIHRIGY